MPVSADFTLDTTNKIIKHTGGTTVYTSNNLYSQIQDWMDDALYMDFTPPMSAQTPTDYQVINGWYLDEGCIEWLQGGAITTNGYLNVIYQLTFQSSGYTSAVATDIGKTVQNTGATHTGTLLAYNNTTMIWWIRAVTSVFTAEALTISGGTGAGTTTAVATGENAFPNIYTLGTIDTTGADQQIYIVQNKVHIQIWGAAGTADPTPAASRHIDVLVKTKSAGTAIDSGNLTLFLRNYPSAGTSGGHQIDLYDNFALTALSGRNAVPLATSNDLNNTSSQATAATYTATIAFVNGTIPHGAITGSYSALETIQGQTSTATGIFLADSAGTMTLGNVVGTFQNAETLKGLTSLATSTSSSTLTVVRTIQNAFTQGTLNPYSIVLDCQGRTLKNIYEYLKYYTRQGATGSSFKTYPVYNNTGPVLNITALDGEQYITAFVDNVTPANTFAATKAAPFGTFAGGKLFGARGVWLQNMASADSQNFQLIDANGTTQIPPNFQNVTVTNLVSGDAVSVFQTTSGTSIKKTQFTMTVQASGLGTITISTAIPTDTPTSGYIRVVQASNNAEQRYWFSSWTGSVFTLAAHTDGYGTALSATTTQAYTASDTAYVPFLDDKVAATSATVQVIYAADRTILVRVRRYNSTVDSILPFETTGTFTSTGYSTQAIRTSDTIVT